MAAIIFLSIPSCKTLASGASAILCIIRSCSHLGFHICSHLTIHILSHLPLQSCSRLLLYIKLPSSTHLCNHLYSALKLYSAAVIFSSTAAVIFYFTAAVMLETTTATNFYSTTEAVYYSCSHLLLHGFNYLLLQKTYFDHRSLLSMHAVLSAVFDFDSTSHLRAHYSISVCNLVTADCLKYPTIVVCLIYDGPLV